MSVRDFAEAQRTLNIVYSDHKLEENTSEELPSIPFVRLLDGNEADETVYKRWELYHQLHAHFHRQVNDIMTNSENDLKAEIYDILVKEKHRPGYFKTLFLLGSDSGTEIELGVTEPDVMDVIMDLSPRECPNTRMMLRRTMFRVFTTGDKYLHQARQDGNSFLGENDEDENNQEEGKDEEEPLETPYDLTLLGNFKTMFGKNLHLVINFKDVDSMIFSTLDDFLEILKNGLRHPHVNISLVFNITTNLSIIEKNLKQSTLRFLKRNYHKLDVSSNKVFKYANKIFQSFLDTVDSKLNLSERFVKFILDKMANNANHSLQLLTKILDYSLMSYFYENPFSVFIDPINVEHLNEHYLKLLSKCPTFMFFLDGLVAEGAPTADIDSLINRKNSALEEFFIEFLVTDNPINGHAKYIARFLEETCDIQNYDLIELYYSLLRGKLTDYLNQWEVCKPHIDELTFEPIDTVFQELFTLDNDNKLLTQAMFPYYKSNMEDDMLCWEKILPLDEARELGIVEKRRKASAKNKTSNRALRELEKLMGPTVGELFKLYREAPAIINIYDFYVAFKETLPRDAVLEFLKEMNEQNNDIGWFFERNQDDDDTVFSKVALILFIQALSDLEHIGVLKPGSLKLSNFLEKLIWRGI